MSSRSAIEVIGKWGDDGQVVVACGDRQLCFRNPDDVWLPPEPVERVVRVVDHYPVSMPSSGTLVASKHVVPQKPQYLGSIGAGILTSLIIVFVIYAIKYWKESEP